MLHTNFHVLSFTLKITHWTYDEAQSPRLTVKIFKRTSERARACVHEELRCETHLRPAIPSFMRHLVYSVKYVVLVNSGRSHGSRGLRSGSAAAGLLRLRVQIPPCAQTSVCVLSGRGLCVRLITRPDKSYRV